MKSRSLLSSALSILLFSFCSQAQVQTARYNAIDANCGGYYEYLPKGYSSTSSQTYPLIVAVHGIGELGNGTTDLYKLLNCWVAIPRRIANGGFPASVTIGGQTFSFIVISPQFKAWPSASDVNAVVDYAVQHYHVDQSRIYVTGLSMGGGAVWDFASAYPTKAAAVVPVCGARSATTSGAQAIAGAKLPVWATHNDGDPKVSVYNTIGWVNLINQYGGNAISSIFQATVHDAWTKTYDPAFTQNGVNIYQWMLQHKKGSSPIVNQPPSASAGADQTITLPQNSVTLKGTASDADGSIASYQWSQTSGPSQATISSASSATTSVGSLVQGKYVFTLKVTDNQGASATSSITVTVNAAPIVNQPPSASAGADQTITLPQNSVTLKGTASDADGSIASYQWSQTSGPSQATISSASSATTSVGSLVQGKYVFTLKVTDNQGASATSSITVTVNAAPIVNQPPSASAGADQTITLPQNSVTLKGTASDADGSIASYQWSQTSGPSQATISSASSATTSVGSLVQGKYVFTLKVTDNQGASATSSITVTVNAAPIVNQPPSASAGADQTITLPQNSVTLKGTASDADGSIASYQWSQTSGPSQATISSASSATTSVGSLVQGKYVFTLKVTDNQGASATSSITVTVNAAPIVNQPPSASAGADQTITLPQNSVTLKGTASDADGSIASYQWSQTSGPSQATISSASSATTSVGSLVQGKYVFTLKVTDNQGASATSSITVTVNAAPIVNQPPSASAGADQTITLPQNSVTLKGTASDADGSIASYQWSQTSGPSQATISSASSATTSFGSLVQGKYVFTLKVTDNQGASATSSITVTVNAAPIVNQPPSASAGADQTITLPQNSVTLKGTASDADGSIASYQWSQTSGPSQATISSASSATTSFGSLVQGKYVFTLKVTDNQGASATSSITVTVNAAPIVNQPPSASAGADQTITLPQNSVTLKGTASDADGSIASYQWSQTSGPSQATISSASSATTSFGSLVQGKYVFTLKVTDNQGASATSSITVTVNAAPIVNQPPSASAGADQTITLPQNSVTLKGTASDADGSIASYQWSQTSGPSQATISSASSATTSVGSLVQGKYVFTLKVTDNQGASATSSITVTVNAAPVPKISGTSLYPNPASNYLYVKIGAATLQNNTFLTISNVAGRVLYRKQFLRTNFIAVQQIDISNLNPGTYFLTLNTDINTTTTLKFVKL